MAFADATKSGPRPIVIFAHGLGGTKDGNWGTTERLADLNAAVIAIDSPEHGSRAADPKTDPLLASFSYFGVDPATQSFDIGRARDNFRQMSSDQLELVRLIGSLGKLDILPVGAPDGVPDLDVSRILYIGHSFGSVQGPAIFATAPEITQAVWNVGGDGLMTLLRDSGTFSLLVNSLKPPHTADGALGRFFAISQAIVDPGDPLNYARFGTLLAAPGVAGWKARDVLLQEVIDDSIVPNSTSEALARAAGLVLADPIRPVSGLPGGAAPLTGNLASGATGVIAQFDKIEGGQMATHGELIFSPEAQPLSMWSSSRRAWPSRTPRCRLRIPSSVSARLSSPSPSPWLSSSAPASSSPPCARTRACPRTRRPSGGWESPLAPAARLHNHARGSAGRPP